MGLISENTNWIFLLLSSMNAEQRYIFDIAFGVHVLLSRKVPLKNIVLHVDGCSDVLLHSTFAAMQVPVPNNVYTTSHYYDLLKNNLYENVVIFITGLGSISCGNLKSDNFQNTRAYACSSLWKMLVQRKNCRNLQKA